MGASTGSAGSAQQSRGRDRQQAGSHGGLCCPAAKSIDISRCTWRPLDGRGKDAALGKHRTLSTFHRHDDEDCRKFHQGLLRREEDERTVQRRAGKPGHSNASLVTEGFKRTGTCGSSSSARRTFLHQEAGYIYADCPFAQLQTSCSPAADHTFSVIVDLPNEGAPDYYIIPTPKLQEFLQESHERWRNTPGKNGRPHGDTTMRTIWMDEDESKVAHGFAVKLERYHNAWDLLR